MEIYLFLLICPVTGVSQLSTFGVELASSASVRPTNAVRCLLAAAPSVLICSTTDIDCLAFPEGSESFALLHRRMAASDHLIPR
jgi:hypothetical protein